LFLSVRRGPNASNGAISIFSFNSRGWYHSGFAQSGQWVAIGSARVNGQVDHDTIQARDKGTFRAIQIRVRGSSVHFNGIIVGYGTGQIQQLTVRDGIKPGNTSRAIELPGARRVIDRIDFFYEKASWGIPPTVTVAGSR
jgi:hypothetical protein